MTNAPTFDVDGIERATIATVSPEATESFDDWLLAFDRGAIGRAKCAVPLTHVAHSPDVIPVIEQRYAARGFPPMFRLPDVPAFQPFNAAVEGQGYRPSRFSLVQIARSTDVRRLAADPDVSIATRPDDAWGRVFLGEGFDPVEGASRVRSLSRAPDAVYASIFDDARGTRDETPGPAGQHREAICVGALSFDSGWAGIHAMRTALKRRREGLAGRILAALAQVAIDRGYERIFLQVEEDNVGAQSLYARAGFASAWKYAYWQR